MTRNPIVLFCMIALCALSACGEDPTQVGPGPVNGACTSNETCEADESCIGGTCQADSDRDGIPETTDNCPLISNPDQADSDGDGIGDACEPVVESPDDDDDGIPNADDNCPLVPNVDQADADNDGIGDACDQDQDGDQDTIPDDDDNCPNVANTGQLDTDNDGMGDACDTDDDNDGVVDDDDNCRLVYNDNQRDRDNDGRGDVCDDDDGDGYTDDKDNCPDVANPTQDDLDGDGIGDLCDPDIDGDGVLNDGDGSGDPTDNPCDDRQTVNCDDNCQTQPNAAQGDTDQDGEGDLCDPNNTRLTGKPFNDQCTYVRTPGPFTPVVEWSLSIQSSDPYGDRDQVMMTPIVVNLTDDNADGVIDTRDTPDIIYTTFATNNNPSNWDELRYGVLRAVSGDGSGLLWSVGAVELGLEVGKGGVQPAGNIAAGDIIKVDVNGNSDNGRPEIVVGLWHDTQETGGFAIVDADGNVRKKSTDQGTSVPRQFNYWWGGPSLADIDGDNDVEIVIGARVFDHNANLVWDGTTNSSLAFEAGQGINSCTPSTFCSSPNLYTGTLSVVADLDRAPINGIYEQEIVTGRTAYKADGGIFWEASATLNDGFPAIGDFNGDGLPEVVVSSRGVVRIHNGQTGAVIWSVDPGNGRMGPPTVADFDGDGIPEIGVAGRNEYIALKVELSNPAPTAAAARLWGKATKDASSNMTGSSVFDFEGDGRAEVVYNDEEFLRVYDGRNGDVLFEQPNTSFTALEYPIVADVDNDGEAEIVVGTNDFECEDRLGCTKGFSGIRVFGAEENQWVSTRRIWNQHTYHINNVTELGQIPAQELPSWNDHNSYRLNAQNSLTPQAAPDLITEDADVSSDTCGTVQVLAWVTNSGAVRVGSGLPVGFWAVDGNTRVLLGEALTLLPLEPGDSERVSLLTSLPAGGPWSIEIVADFDTANGVSTRNECNENNNATTVATGLTCP